MNDTARITGCRTVLFALLIAALITGSIVMPQPRASALGATWYVSSVPSSVDGNCTTPAKPCRHIYYAIGRAAPGDVINVAAGIYFENIQIAKSLSLQGAGAGLTIIDGSSIGPVANIFGSGGNVNVNLTNFTLQHGSAPDGFYTYGGGIYNTSDGVLSVANSEIITNTARDGGGGIYSTGQLVLNHVIVRGNTITGAQSGGGLLFAGTTADLTNVTLTGNTAPFGGGIGNLGILNLANVVVDGNQAGQSGGGIYNKGGQIAMLAGAIQNNQAKLGGGGIFNTSLTPTTPGQLYFNGATIQNNTTTGSSLGGGLYNESAATFINVTLVSNQAQGGGGAIFNSTAAQLTLNAGLILNNTAQSSSGGGINNQGVLNLTASTLAGNTSASLQGGGVFNSSTGSATLTLVTLSANTTPVSNGGAIYNDGGSVQIKSATIAQNTDPGVVSIGGTMSVANTLIAQHNGGTGGANCTGTITSNNYNLESGNSCGFNKPNDQVGKDPGLDALQYNGGPTPTRAPKSFSSPIVNAGDPDAANCQTTDQRGVPRPQGGQCDIGAYEIVGFENIPSSGIPPAGCTTSSINIAATYLIGKMNVGVNATFNARGNLRVTLVSPTGRRVTLLGPTGGNGVNLDALFDDSGSGVADNGPNDIAAPYYDTVYKPYAALSQLNNTSIKGIWTLEVCSTTSTTGTLNRWLILVPEVATFVKIYMPVVRRK